jgi:hypothetical protein
MFSLIAHQVLSRRCCRRNVGLLFLNFHSSYCNYYVAARRSGKTSNSTVNLWDGLHLSACVVSYVAVLIDVLLVEFPCASLWKDFVASSKINQSSTSPREREREQEREYASFPSVVSGT